MGKIRILTLVCSIWVNYYALCILLFIIIVKEKELIVRSLTDSLCSTEKEISDKFEERERSLIGQHEAEVQSLNDKFQKQKSTTDGKLYIQRKPNG